MLHDLLYHITNMLTSLSRDLTNLCHFNRLGPVERRAGALHRLEILDQIIADGEAPSS
jgi:hypothetical protein